MDGTPIETRIGEALPRKDMTHQELDSDDLERFRNSHS